MRLVTSDCPDDKLQTPHLAVGLTGVASLIYLHCSHRLASLPPSGYLFTYAGPCTRNAFPLLLVELVILSDLRTIILCLPSQASQFFASGSPHLSSTHLSIKAQGGILGHNAFFTGSLSEDVWGGEMGGLLEVQFSPDSCELRSQRRLNPAMY